MRRQSSEPDDMEEWVEVITYRKSDDFPAILRGNNLLGPCQQELRRAGYNSDLTEHRLGRGWMFVYPSHARQVIEQLVHSGVVTRPTEVS